MEHQLGDRQSETPLENLVNSSFQNDLEKELEATEKKKTKYRKLDEG